MRYDMISFELTWRGTAKHKDLFSLFENIMGHEELRMCCSSRRPEKKYPGLQRREHQSHFQVSYRGIGLRPMPPDYFTRLPEMDKCQLSVSWLVSSILK
jgi:hypothetical protein